MKRIFPLLLAALLLTACQETDYMTFDTSHNGVYIEEDKDSMFYSIGVSPESKTSHTVEIPVNIM
ncbi:lipoprotein, partial [Bacteroides sp.]